MSSTNLSSFQTIAVAVVFLLMAGVGTIEAQTETAVKELTSADNLERARAILSNTPDKPKGKDKP